jgi:hypothetical protein
MDIPRLDTNLYCFFCLLLLLLNHLPPDITSGQGLETIFKLFIFTHYLQRLMIRHFFKRQNDERRVRN